MKIYAVEATGPGNKIVAVTYTQDKDYADNFIQTLPGEVYKDASIVEYDAPDDKLAEYVIQYLSTDSNFLNFLVKNAFATKI